MTNIREGETPSAENLEDILAASFNDIEDDYILLDYEKSETFNFVKYGVEMKIKIQAEYME